MTQMGLDYVKHMENKRHNLASESIDTRKTEIEQGKLAESVRHNQAAEGISQQEADTKQYVASFEDRKVGASEIQAEASKLKAMTEYNYAGRKVAAEEKKAAAALAQADVAAVKAEIEKAKTYLNSLSGYDRAFQAGNVMGYDSNGITNTVRGINTMLDSILNFVGRIIA